MPVVFKGYQPIFDEIIYPQGISIIPALRPHLDQDDFFDFVFVPKSIYDKFLLSISRLAKEFNELTPRMQKRRLSFRCYCTEKNYFISQSKTTDEFSIIHSMVLNPDKHILEYAEKNCTSANLDDGEFELSPLRLFQNTGNEDLICNESLLLNIYQFDEEIRRVPIPSKSSRIIHGIEYLNDSNDIIFALESSDEPKRTTIADSLESGHRMLLGFQDSMEVEDPYRKNNEPDNTTYVKIG